MNPQAPTHANLWHGFSLDAIDRLAATAARRATGRHVLDPDDAYEAAWGAIVEHLAAAEAAPEPRELVAAGMNAVGREAEAHRRTWGMGRTGDSPLGDRPRFQAYWETWRITPSPETGIIERLALHQIWPHLSLTYRQALYAHALHGADDRAAATSLGWTLQTYQSYLRRARAAYRALWHEHEKPSGMWGRTGHGTRTGIQALATRRRQRARRAAAAA